MKSFQFFLSICLVLFLFSCQNEPPVQPDDEPAPAIFKLLTGSIPAEVDSIAGKLERPGYDPIERGFSVSGDTATADFGQIAAGQWHLSVSAFNTSGDVIYFGETLVMINAGQVNIVYLQMNPVTGELIVKIYWGGSSSLDYGLKFDGNDDLLLVFDNDGNLDDLTDQITIEGWIYLNATAGWGHKPRIIDRSDDGNMDRWLLHIMEGTTMLNFNINKNKVNSSPLPLFTWVHVAATYNGNSMKVYVMGDLENTLDVTTTIDVKNSNTYIGSADPIVSSSLGTFTGLINELRVWNTAKSALEISYLMNQTLTGSEQGLIAYWKFDEGLGQTTVDSATNNNARLGNSIQPDSQDPAWVMIN